MTSATGSRRPGTRRGGERLKVAALGSGSEGNAVLLEGRHARVLVDAGFSGIEVERRLCALGVEPETVNALVITHEHRDHTSGMGILARRFGWPLHLSEPTARACDDLLYGEETLHFYRAEEPFRVEDLEFRPFLTCHDSVEPLALAAVESETGHKVGLATDLGRATTSVRAALRECHFLILEANHDEVLLREGPYPWSVKQRIAGSRGHLSNRLAADLARELHHPDLAGVLLFHLSQRCNEPERARSRVNNALRQEGFDGELDVAVQEEPSRLFDISDLLSRVRSAGGRPQLGLFEG